ncbi:MAG TPA: SlyX family protein [Steroidobacteraceae bacterium]|nr:SlyX family protein [Steroidobacteraceae bacterium]
MDQRIEQLEVKVAFLEQANAQLGEQIYRQRQELAALRTRLDGLLERMEAAQTQSTAYTPEQEKPPHY